MRMRPGRFLAGLFFAFSPAAELEAGPQPGLVSVTFDDASHQQFDPGLRLALEHGIVGTLFVPTGLVGDGPDADDWMMTWDQVRAFHAAGWEIGVHGKSHVVLPGLDPESLAAEILDPFADIVAHVGMAPVSFSSPFGAFTDVTLDAIIAQYRAHLSWKGHGGRNPRAAIDPRQIGRLEVVNTMTAREVCGEMAVTARDDTWLVLLFHGISEGAPGDYEVSAAMVGEIFSCAAYLDRSGLIDVVTVREALQMIEAAR